MIKNKECLKQYVTADRNAMLGGRSSLKEFLRGNSDDVLLFYFVKRLRKLEFYRYLYKNKGGGFIMQFAILSLSICLCIFGASITYSCHLGVSEKGCT